MIEPLEEVICPLCEEPVDDGADAVPTGTLEGRRPAHRECLLREVLGGIGHLTNHNYWCDAQHDPDGGMTRRESSLAVDAWVHQHGVQAAAAVPGGPPHEGERLRAERDRIAALPKQPGE